MKVNGQPKCSECGKKANNHKNCKTIFYTYSCGHSTFMPKKRYNSLKVYGSLPKNCRECNVKNMKRFAINKTVR